MSDDDRRVATACLVIARPDDESGRSVAEPVCPLMRRDAQRCDRIMSSGERSDGLHAPVFRFDTDEPWRLVQPFLDANAPREILAKVAGRHAAGADQRRCVPTGKQNQPVRSEEHTSELRSLMRLSYAVFCLTNNKTAR